LRFANFILSNLTLEAETVYPIPRLKIAIPICFPSLADTMRYRRGKSSSSSTPQGILWRRRIVVTTAGWRTRQSTTPKHGLPQTPLFDEVEPFERDVPRYFLAVTRLAPDAVGIFERFPNLRHGADSAFFRFG
jgi:hypothetical protein